MKKRKFARKDQPKRYLDLPSYKELIKSDVDLFISIAKYNKSITRSLEDDSELDVDALSDIRCYLDALVSDSDIKLNSDTKVLRETYKMYSFKGARRMMIKLSRALLFSQKHLGAKSKASLLKDLLNLSAIDSNGWFFKYSIGLAVKLDPSLLGEYVEVIKAVFRKGEFNYRYELDSFCNLHGYSPIIVERLLHILGHSIVKSGRDRFHLSLKETHSYNCPLNGSIDDYVERFMATHNLYLQKQDSNGK